jgi:hypothetical protein
MWRSNARLPVGRRRVFEWVDPELDPGMCDRLPLLQGFAVETVMARLAGA